MIQADKTNVRIVLIYPSEILSEERVSDCETMKRENRRVAAMSWNAGDDLPPPKPSRGTHTGKIISIEY